MLTAYQRQLTSPHWQRKRLEIFQRDDFICRWCGDKETELVVHHVKYLPGVKAWEHPSDLLLTICTPCHEEAHGKRGGTPSKIIIELPYCRHGYANFIAGIWRCSCGCGEEWTRAQWEAIP